MPERSKPRTPDVSVGHKRISSPNSKRHAENPFPKPRTLLWKMTKLPVIRNAFKFAYRTFLPSVSPELTLAMRHLKVFGYWPNLRQPSTFNEKIHWKKLNDRREVVARTSDKFAVRQYVRAKGLEDILIPLLWQGIDPGAIPFEQLPPSFVVKPAHLSGAVVIVRDRTAADLSAIVAQAEEWMVTTYASKYLEWAYTQAEPRILIEEFKQGGDGEAPCDYKFFCFHGEPQLCQVDLQRFTDHRRNIYSLDWRILPAKYNYKNGADVPRPATLQRMIGICRTLSREFDFVRVDLYSIGNHVFFGELTHYPEAGFGRFDPPAFDLEMGRYWSVNMPPATPSRG